MIEKPQDQKAKRSKGNSIFVLVTVTLLYVINYMDRTVLSVTLPLIKADLSLSDAQLGWLGTIYFIAVACLTIPASLVIDRWSRKKSLALMALLWSVATFLTGTGKSFLSLLSARGLVGIGEAGFAPGGLTYISGSFGEKSWAKVNGIFVMGGPIGLILGAVLGGYIAKANILGLGWRAPYFFFAFPGILLGILILFTKDYTTGIPKEYSTDRGIVEDMSVIMKLRTFWYLSLGFAVSSFAITAILQFLPLYFMRTRGWDVTKSSSMFGLMFAFAAIGAIFAGIFSDKWKEKRVNGRPLTAATLTLIGFVCITSGMVAEIKGYFFIGYIGFVVLAVVGAAVISPLSASIMDLVPLRLRSLSVSMIIFIGYMLGSLGPTAIGWVSDMMGTPGNPDMMAAFRTIPVFYFIAALLYFIGARTFVSEFKICTSQGEGNGY
ncbi:MFS transporter [bacterium]|nr:MFS transporter [bacterium]